MVRVSFIYQCSEQKDDQHGSSLKAYLEGSLKLFLEDIYKSSLGVRARSFSLKAPSALPELKKLSE